MLRVWKTESQQALIILIYFDLTLYLGYLALSLPDAMILRNLG